ncbi:cell division protein [Bacillus sp. M6-12]|uniref:cell division FtsA domain-containing protein n=1 Tax=Bacillus sp. M6-12 TaxID=2054166 RepID=UPI000C793EA2|nr:cell division FtsA domain-containing protein [Bacillus sp. M6-12]PLS14868.1 cell division protein [Bacillus sp. M6-12]
MQEKIFALDIGTRSVVGIILEKQKDSFHVADILTKEHQERAMMDGQIHDVIAVSKVITEIKTELESKHGKLERVCVAAAGRALKTERALITADIKDKPLIQRDDILHLELSAVQKAQSIVAENSSDSRAYHYYCVGYSVLYYRLDGQEIGSLIDQNGEEASVEIIATFLPKVVVESLLAALKRAELEMQALTLEPIAAINVLIPPSMRRLNVALVDIGAGTSDIALTDMGTVIAYGMVPIAGDEITEAISSQLLLDFPLAETAKRELTGQDSIVIHDILGFESTISRTEIIQQISPSLNRLADAISNEILQLNNAKPPKAIMLVGGGSLTPELPKLLSEKMGLPINRVAIRGIDAIQKLTFSGHLQKGPELVTPIGIAIAAQNNPIQYLNVSVNDQTVRLFDMKQLTVGDCLLSAGIKINKLYGKPGMAIIISLNGQMITIPGIHGSKPTLLLNGIAASLDDMVHNNDRIIVEKGTDGTQPVLKIRDLIDDIPRKEITINRTKYAVEAVIKKNGSIAFAEDSLHDRDTIECRLPETIQGLLEALNLNYYLNRLKPFTVFINGKEVSLDKHAGRILKNSVEVKLGSSFADSDNIIIESPSSPKLADLAASLNLQLSYSIPVSFNGKRILVTKRISEFTRGDDVLSEDDELEVGEHITLIQHKYEPFIFQDIFRHVDIDLPQPANGHFVLVKNNEETSFHDIISPGDELRIIWPTMAKWQK